MQDMGGRIVSYFQSRPYTEIATSDIVKALYTDEYQRLKGALHDPVSDKESRMVARRHKGQLHRRILYHLNRLVHEEYLIVSSVKGKGEKCYTLKSQDLPRTAGIGEEEGFQRTPTPTTPPPTQPLLKLDSYQQRKIITGFDPGGWHSRLNAILLESASEENLEGIALKIGKILPWVNDAIGLNGFEQALLREDLSSATAFLRKVDVDMKDVSRRLTIIIDLTTIPEQHSYIEDFITAYAIINPTNIQLLFSIDRKGLSHQQRLLKHIVRNFSLATIKLNLHQKDAHHAPYIIGKGGTYTIDDTEWQEYLSQIKGKTIGLCFGQVSVAIDIERFNKYEKSPQAFREFLRKVARSLVESSTLQRRRSDLYFGELNTLNERPHEFFRFSTAYIRLWNYDWQGQDQPHVLDLLSSCAEELAEFCRTEETIYKSCGIPIRFKATMGSAFPRFEQGFFSKRSYQKLTLTGLESLKLKSMESYLEARERLFRIFNGNDRLRLFRALPANPEAVVAEARQVLTQHTIPLMCLDFTKRHENLTLDQFIPAEPSEEDPHEEKEENDHPSGGGSDE